MRFAWVFVLVAGIICAASARADEPIRLVYNDRPPFKMTLPDGTAGGTSAETAGSVFTQAGIPFIWQEIPAARQVAEIEKNLERICAVGFHETPDRERFALFTQAIDREMPLVAVGGPGAGISDGISLDRLLGDPNVLIELKLSRSYGNVLNTRLKAAKARIEPTSLNLEAIVEMIRAGRPIVTFMSQREIDYYLSDGTIAADAVRIAHFPELAPGETLHIMCSKNVGRDVIDRLDRVIGRERPGSSKQGRS